MKADKTKSDKLEAEDAAMTKAGADNVVPSPKEVNGPTGPEPTRYGDWEQKGRCTDF
tara:strand:- start:982 stop:1152 length:171 start_codon:yes stop_codon:yes gene_type:complete